MTYITDPPIDPIRTRPLTTESLDSALSLWAGDWLLTFPAGAPMTTARVASAPWQPDRRGESWQLWITSPARGWRGMPLTRIDTGRGPAWLAGELFGVGDGFAAVRDVVEGRTPATSLNGHFLLLAYNHAPDEWSVWTNRHATLHAYMATDGERTAVGTFLPSVAAAAGCTELDWEGLAGFFGFGFFAADRTHLAGARILRPATHYRLDGCGRLLSAERYWRWRHEPDPARSYAETLEEFAALFSAVMGDMTATGRIAVPISGGLDSRSTVAAIAPVAGGEGSAAGRLWAYSYGYDGDSIETRIAGQVAAAHGLPFNAYTISPYLFDRLPGIVAAVEGFEDVTQCRQAAVIDEIDDHADFVIAAHWGDVYLDDMGVDPAHDTADLAGVALNKFKKGGRQWLHEELCRPHLGGREADALLREILSAELDRVGLVDDPDFTIKMLKTDQWSARWTTVALRMFQAAAFPRLPFYDTRLEDFFLTVPTDFVRGRRLQIDYLKRYAPDLARIPWQATGRDLFHSGGDNILDTARRAARKGRRLLSGRQLRERNWEIQFLGHGGQAGLARWLLRDGLAVHEYVPPAAVRTLLEGFNRDPLADKRSFTVAMLLSFSAWLELQRPGEAN